MRLDTTYKRCQCTGLTSIGGENFLHRYEVFPTRSITVIIRTVLIVKCCKRCVINMQVMQLQQITNINLGHLRPTLVIYDKIVI